MAKNKIQLMRQLKWYIWFDPEPNNPTIMSEPDQVMLDEYQFLQSYLHFRDEILNPAAFDFCIKVLGYLIISRYMQILQRVCIFNIQYSMIGFF